eukprot:1157213-Pelagomonas_calceolata.AAC.5
MTNARWVVGGISMRVQSEMGCWLGMNQMSHVRWVLGGISTSYHPCKVGCGWGTDQESNVAWAVGGAPTRSPMWRGLWVGCRQSDPCNADYW